MSDAGTITVRLNAVTADFQQKMGQATKAIDEINNKLSLDKAMQFGRMLAKGIMQAAEVMPELQAAIDDLDKTWKNFLATAFGETFKTGLELLTKFVELSSRAANAWKDLSSFAIGKAIGMSDAEMQAGLVDTQAARTLQSNTLDFGGKAASPTSTLDYGNMLEPAKDKWAGGKLDFVFGGMEDMMASLVQNGVEGLDFSKIAVDDATVSAMSDGLTTGLKELLDLAAENASTARRSQVAEVTARNRQVVEETMALGAIGQRGIGATGFAGQITNNAAQAGSAAGPFGALASIGMDLITSSVGFKALMNTINPLLESFSNLLGLLLFPLKLLAPLFKTIGDVVASVTLGIYKMLDLIPGLDFSDEIRELRKQKKGEAAASKEVADTLKESFSNLNVPQGVKMALARYKAIDVGTGSGTATEGGPAAGYGAVVVQSLVMQGMTPDEMQAFLAGTAEVETYKQTGQTPALNSGRTAH